MIEPEVAFMDLEGDMDLAEAFLTHIVATVLSNHRADLKVIGRDIAKLEAVIATADPTESGAPGSTASSSTLGSIPSAPENSRVSRGEGAAAVEGPAVPA